MELDKEMNNYFKHIECVNLARRPDKWSEAEAEFKKANLVVERFEAIDGKTVKGYHGRLSPGSIGNTMSHLEIIKKARDNGHESVLLLEDDVVFIEDVNKVFNERINQVPDDWDLLYLGGNHNNTPIVMISDHVRIIESTYATHAYAVKNTIYDKLIERLSNIDTEGDVMMAEIQKTCKAYCFTPRLAWQRPGVSDIWNVYVDYSFLRDRDGNTII